MWVEIAIGLYTLGSYIYHRYVEDQPQAPTPPQINVPQVAEGTPLPLLYGRCRVRAPILVWSGNYLHPGQTFTRVFDGSTQTADHFSLDALFVLGVPFYGGGGGTLFNGWAGDTGLNVAIVTSITGQPFLAGDLSSSTTFSIAGACPPGDALQDVAHSGPVTSTVTYQDGVSYAVATDIGGATLQSGDDINLFPGYRNQMCMYAHIALGLTPDIPSLSWEVVTTSRGSASDMGIGWGRFGDADPAAVLYDLLTSPWGKLAIPTSKVELSTFQAASATLFSELHGYSRAIEQAEDANVIIQDILKQIDAVMYPEPTTGKIELHLIRNDYVLATLQDINPSNAILDEYTVQSWSEMPNQVRIIWTDSTANYGDAVQIGQNGSAAIAGGNRLRSVTIQYKGCRSVVLATALASRELAVISRPLAKANVTCNRAFYQARPGSVYTLTWPELGIDHMVMRVAQANHGQLHQEKIALSLMRDVFDTKIGAFPT